MYVYIIHIILDTINCIESFDSTAKKYSEQLSNHIATTGNHPEHHNNGTMC